MTESLTIGAVMTPFPYSIDIDAHANSAKAMLAQLKIHHLPVMEDNVPVSVITDRDIRRAKDLGVDVSIGSAAKVRDIIELAVYAVNPDEPLDDVLMHMSENHVEVAVVIQAGKLAGIFTVTDVCRRYAELIRSLPVEKETSLDDEFRS